MKRYIFIHPTKCGGTAINNFFMKVYPYHTITNIGFKHEKKCKDYDNPVIIVREPIDRFISMFKYWKSGGMQFKDYEDITRERIRKKDFNDKYMNYTIKDFISLLKRKDICLYKDFTFPVHYETMFYWIKPEDYSKTIVITYCEDLNNRLPEILKALEIESVGKNLDKINVSKNQEAIKLDEEDLKYIKSVYKYDIELWDNIHNNPSIFKKVL